jgi:crotonobetainyl-CoA:carnitine CoA-transferase CaiB-like acyl-CoA transferase
VIYRGVRIVELAAGIAGPFATMFLADHGADVVKVEPPGGDHYRSEPGFQTFNRNKRSVVVDDPTPLVATADVVVTDRPGHAAELRRHAPGAVIVSLPAWGERGPLVGAPATADLLAAATGIMWNQQSYSEAPVHIVVPFVPYATATLGALAIATGLYARARHGWAPTYEVSQVAGAAALQLEQFRLGDEVEERDGSAPMGSKGRVPIYRLFRAGDDRWFFLACGTVRFYERLLEVIGRPELRDHPLLPAPPWGLMALDAIAFIAPILEETFETKPRDEWLRLLRAADIPAQPVQSRAEFLASPLCAANGLDVRVDHPDLGPVDMMGVPVVMEAAPGRVARHAPRLGEHTDEVLAEPVRTPPPPAPAGDGSPLAGVRVIDLSSFIAGPVVSRHLAMLGADVVKVESPAGDPFRAFGPPFANWNQGKRSIVIDLTAPAGRELLDRLVDRSDVVIENFRPGVAERLGADHRRLRARKPELVFLSSPGYGDDEAMADAPAFDPLMQALGGLMFAQGGLAADGSGFAAAVDGAEPVFLTVPIHDVVTPIIGAFGLVSALYHRARTGEAQRVRTSLAQATVVVQAAELTRYRGSAPTLAGGFDFRGPAEDRCCVEGEDGWWFQDGPHRAPIVRTGLVNQAIAADNDLLVSHDHPAFGPLTSFGQLVVGAGPPPDRAPLLDEHRDQILTELAS